MLSFIFVAIGLAAAMTIAWAIQRATGNSGWIDTIWSFATAAAGAALALATPTPRALLAATIIIIWGARLGLHIALRSAKSPDDPRYAALQTEWGANFQSRLFWFLMIQAACALVLATCVWTGAQNPSPFPAPQDFLAGLILLAGIAGEALADAQLTSFRANPANRGQVCEAGLWAWSRHPNYFFEWLVWLAWPIMALPTPYAILALAGPALMYWLLVHASGIPPLETQMLKSRGARYADYQRRVSAFFPLPPKKS